MIPVIDTPSKRSSSGSWSTPCARSGTCSGSTGRCHDCGHFDLVHRSSSVSPARDDHLGQVAQPRAAHDNLATVSVTTPGITKVWLSCHGQIPDRLLHTRLDDANHGVVVVTNRVSSAPASDVYRVLRVLVALAVGLRDTHIGRVGTQRGLRPAKNAKSATKSRSG